MRAGRGGVPGSGGLRAPPPPLLLLLLAMLPAAAPRSPALAAAPAGPSVSLYLSEDEVRRLLGEWRGSRGLVSPRCCRCAARALSLSPSLQPPCACHSRPRSSGASESALGTRVAAP